MSSLTVLLMTLALSAALGAIPLAISARRNAGADAPVRQPTPSVAATHGRCWWGLLTLVGPLLWLLWAAAAKLRAAGALAAAAMVVILLVTAWILPEEWN